MPIDFSNCDKVEIVVSNANAIPFTQPFTAPDGTTRRPLAERVPECVPRPDPTAPGGFACLRGLPVLEQVDYALWRVAVEDWLRNTGKHVTLFDSDPGSSEIVWLYWPGHALAIHDDVVKDQVEVAGTTLPDALNAAAHAVADANGIPH